MTTKIRLATVLLLTMLAAACQSNSKEDQDAGCPEYLTGQLEWAARAGGLDNDVARNVAALADGTFLVTGYFHGAAVFGDGEPNQTTLAEVETENTPGFVAKYDGEGALVWVKDIGVQGFRMDAADDGSFVIAGAFRDQAVFGAGGPNETTLTAHGDDVFLSRYDANGSLLWVRNARTDHFATPFAVDLLPNGAVLIAGYFGGTYSGDWIAFEDAEGHTIQLVSRGQTDAFLARYDADGNAEWAAQAGGLGQDRIVGIAAAEDGAFGIVGSFGGASWDYTGSNYSALFGESGNQAAVFTVGDPMSEDAFVASYDADRNLRWVRTAGSDEAHAEADGVAALGDGAYLFGATSTWGAVFGEGSGEVVFPEIGGSDIYFGKYDADGSLAWVKQAGGGSADHCRQMVLLDDGGFLLGGSFSSYYSPPPIFGRGEAAETQLDSLGSEDIYAARFAVDGTLVWVASAGTGDTDFLEGLAADSCGSAFLVGGFEQTMKFDVGGIVEWPLQSAGQHDIYIARLAP